MKLNKTFKTLLVTLFLVFQLVGTMNNAYRSHSLKSDSIFELDKKSNSFAEVPDTTLAMAFSRFVSLHVLGLENELKMLRDAIMGNDNLPKNYKEKLRDENSEYFNSYIISLSLINSSYALTNPGEFNSELFSYWINLPKEDRNPFWNLVDYFYVKIVPSILGEKDSEKIYEKIDATKDVFGLTIDVETLNNNETYIDYLILDQEINGITNRNAGYFDWIISIATNIWSNPPVTAELVFEQKYLDSFKLDGTWISESEISNISEKIDSILTTRIDKGTYQKEINVLYYDFDALNDDLKEATKLIDNNEIWYGINLSSAISSAINYNNILWNKYDSPHYLDFEVTIGNIKDKLLRVFNYIFYIYNERMDYPNNRSYLNIISTITILNNDEFVNKGVLGSMSEIISEPDGLYGTAMVLSFDLWKYFEKTQNILTSVGTKFEDTLVHEIGHIIEWMHDTLDWNKGGALLFDNSENTLKYFKSRDKYSKHRFGEGDAIYDDPIENKRESEIVKYKDLDTPTLMMNIDKVDTLYFEIRREIESYIKLFKNDEWGEGKDLSGIMDEVYISVNDMPLDMAVTEMMESYNSGEQKPFKIKLTPLYGFKDDIDIQFNIINTKKQFTNINEIDMGNTFVQISDNEDESIENVKQEVAKQLEKNGLSGLKWNVISNGKFVDINDFKFETGNNRSMNIIVFGDDKQYGGYTTLKMDYSLKMHLSKLVTVTDLGLVESTNPKYLLGLVEDANPGSKGKIKFITSDAIINGQIKVGATSDINNEYTGTVIIQYHYDNTIIPDPEEPNFDETSSNWIEVVLPIILIIFGVVIIGTAVLFIIIKKKKRKN